MPRRRPMRLRHFDYSSSGAYFVTICTRYRLCVLSNVMDGNVLLNEYGRIVESVWKNLPRHYPHVQMDACIIMPNHIHGIVMLHTEGVDDSSKERAGFKPAPTGECPKLHALTEVVRGFKTFSARKINALRGTTGTSLWQRGYFEHVIRGESSLDRIRQYIGDNPMRWCEDPENPLVRGQGKRAGFKPAPTEDKTLPTGGYLMV